MLILALVAAVALPTIPIARADWCSTAHCTTGVYTRNDCAVNETIGGQTCVRAAAIVINGLYYNGNQVVPLYLFVYHEDSSGNVEMYNTQNAWTGDVTTVAMNSDSPSPMGVTVYGYQSNQYPGGAPTGQVDREVALYGAGSVVPVGLDILEYNSLPRTCVITSPAGVMSEDCSLDPVEELLP
ncbi:MAG: hypothetical protein ACYDCK_08925 [Thermoplasmatota archaeon]